jgi:cardiolipin synthase A/B
MTRALPLLLLLGCSAAGPHDDVDATQPVDVDAAIDPGPDFCNATDPRTVPVEVVATPEAGEAPYLAALGTAQHSISVEIYEMGYGGILDALDAKAAAGVTVRVILDQSKKSVNQKYYDQLAAAGAQPKWSDPRFVYQHAKFIVVDGKTAVISTGNFSKTYSIDLERNFVATDTDPADLADLVTLFEADWAGVAPVLDCTRMVISPINARPRILELIASAQSTLTIESMQFADYAVRDAVKARVEAGVAVRAILADAGFVSSNTYAATFLQGLGVTVKSIPHMHTKVIVADSVHAYVGSENLSQNSLDNNREVGVILTDASSLAPLVSTFETDWTAGTSF